MSKNKFYSRLFQKYILKGDKDFKSYLIAELLYRIDELEFLNCSCIGHQMELDKYKKYYEKIMDRKEVKPSESDNPDSPK